MDKKLGYMALVSALFISTVAIYFSVAGLAAIFSAYAISIIIMGTSIELGKLVAVLWLHHNWNDKILVLKAGLSFFVVGVMLITSMGIFGYLSKSHVEQTSASQQNVALVQQVDDDIARNKATISRSETRILGYETNGSSVDASIQTQIDKEQKRIDQAYNRVKPVIQVQLDIIKSGKAGLLDRSKPYSDEIEQINSDLRAVELALQDGKIRKAQRLIGTNDDNSYGVKTITALKDYRESKSTRRSWLQSKTDQIKSSLPSSVTNAEHEIKSIRSSVQLQITESNRTIKSLRKRLGKSNSNDIESLIVLEQKKIKKSNIELDKLIPKKFQMESTQRKLVAELGPIKYFAEFVYGTKADADLLEKAVKWLIILLIFVFDPFAVFLLIAAQHSFEKHWKNHPKPKFLQDPEPSDDETEPQFPENETVIETEVLPAKIEAKKTPKKPLEIDTAAILAQDLPAKTEDETPMSASAIAYTTGMKNDKYKVTDKEGAPEAKLENKKNKPDPKRMALGDPIRIKGVLGVDSSIDPHEKFK